MQEMSISLHLDINTENTVHTKIVLLQDILEININQLKLIIRLHKLIEMENV